MSKPSHRIGRTAAQKERQRPEHREKGKYAKVNPCLGCGKSAGIDYLSHPLTDVGDWHDIAICLCKKCAVATESFTNPEEFEAYAKLKGGMT